MGSCSSAVQRGAASHCFLPVAPPPHEQTPLVGRPTFQALPVLTLHGRIPCAPIGIWDHRAVRKRASFVLDRLAGRRRHLHHVSRSYWSGRRALST